MLVAGFVLNKFMTEFLGGWLNDKCTELNKIKQTRI